MVDLCTLVIPSLLIFYSSVFCSKEEKYIKVVDGLKHMLDRYHSVLSSLDNAEVSEDELRFGIGLKPSA